MTDAEGHEVATYRDEANSVHHVVCEHPRCNFRASYADNRGGIKDAGKVARGKALQHEGQYPDHDVAVREVSA